MMESSQFLSCLYQFRITFRSAWPKPFCVLALRLAVVLLVTLILSPNKQLWKQNCSFWPMNWSQVEIPKRGKQQVGLCKFDACKEKNLGPFQWNYLSLAKKLTYLVLQLWKPENTVDEIESGPCCLQFSSLVLVFLFTNCHISPLFWGSVGCVLPTHSIICTRNPELESIGGVFGEGRVYGCV